MTRALSGGLVAANSSVDELDALEEAGCDYFVIDPQTAPAGVVGRPDVGTFVMMSEAADRETAVALRSLGVDGTLNTSAVGSGDLTFDSLVQLTKVGASTGGVMLVRVESDVSLTDLGALRDAGVNGVVVSAGTRAGKDLLKQLVQVNQRIASAQTGGVSQNAGGCAAQFRLGGLLTPTCHCPKARRLIKNSGNPCERIFSWVAAKSYSMR